MHVRIYDAVMKGHINKQITVQGSQEFINYLSSESLPTMKWQLKSQKYTIFLHELKTHEDVYYGGLVIFLLYKLDALSF